MIFVEESNESYLALDIDCSFKVDLNNLKNIRFKIIKKELPEEIIHDELIDLQKYLDSFKLENMLFHPF